MPISELLKLYDIDQSEIGVGGEDEEDEGQDEEEDYTSDDGNHTSLIILC